MLGLRPPAGTPCVGQLERKPELLRAGATDGERLVEAALGGRLAGRLDLQVAFGARPVDGAPEGVLDRRVLQAEFGRRA